MGVDDHADSGTNHIYASGQPSVIQNSGGDRHGRPGDPLKANPSFDPNKEDAGADKYYRNVAGSGAAVPNKKADTVSIYSPQSTTPLMLSNESELGGVLDLSLDRVRAGQRKVIVQVTDADLTRRLKARLDMAQARGSIDMKQRKAIQVGRPVNMLDAAVPTGLTPEEVEAKLPDRTPTTAAAAEEDLALDVDPMAYVNGDLDEDVLDPVAAQPIEGGLAASPALEEAVKVADDAPDYFGDEDTDDEDLSEPPEPS